MQETICLTFYKSIILFFQKALKFRTVEIVFESTCDLNQD